MKKSTGNQTVERSYEPLTKTQLAELSGIALSELWELFKRNPNGSGLYSDRLLAVCLCQGGAEHYVRRTHGIKDLDIWCFFSALPEGPPFPSRWRKCADFGLSSHGRHPNDDPQKFRGRRVDIMGRSIPYVKNQPPEASIQHWLRTGTSKSKGSPYFIARSPVVLIHLPDRLGDVIWNLLSEPPPSRGVQEIFRGARTRPFSHPRSL